MVLGSLRHDANLLLGEPSTQIAVATDNLGRDFMMTVTTFAKPGVVVGSNGKNHIGIDVAQLLGNLLTLPNDHQDMVALMGLVKAIVSGQDVFLDILPKGVVDRFCHRGIFRKTLQSYNFYTKIVQSDE